MTQKISGAELELLLKVVTLTAKSHYFRLKPSQHKPQKV